MEMRQILDALHDFGLSANEAKSYLALTKLNMATTGDVAKEAQIHNSKSHEALHSLVTKGLASYQIRGKMKIFFALDPEILIEKTEEKEKKLRDSVTELKKFKTQQPLKQGIYAYEKIEGIKTIFRNFLREMQPDSEYLVLAGRALNLKLEGFLLDFHKKRAEKGVKTKIVHCLANWEYAQLREKIKSTEVRYVQEYNPASINIYKDYVGIIASAEEPMGVIIKSKEIADSFREYFKIIWKNAQPSKQVRILMKSALTKK